VAGDGAAGGIAGHGQNSVPSYPTARSAPASTETPAAGQGVDGLGGQATSGHRRSWLQRTHATGCMFPPLIEPCHAERCKRVSCDTPVQTPQVARFPKQREGREARGDSGPVGGLQLTGPGRPKRPSGPQGNPTRACAAGGGRPGLAPHRGVPGGRPPGQILRALGEALKGPSIGRRRVATGANHPASQSSALRRGPGTPAGAPTGDQSTGLNATPNPTTMHTTRNTF
jgi:hypothetical protein